MPGTSLQLQIVFDDAVVDHGDFSGVGHVGMAVDVGGGSMGRPAGVPDAEGALNGSSSVDESAEIGQTALGLGDPEDAVGHDADAGGVIAPVFQLRQSLQ